MVHNHDQAGVKWGGGANLVHPPLVADTELKWGGGWIYFGKKNPDLGTQKFLRHIFSVSH